MTPVTDPAPVYVSVAEAARMLGVGRASIYNHLSELETTRFGGRRLVKVASILALADRPA
jgi:hypothetical protein